MRYLNDQSVTVNPDGTYTITDFVGGDWTLRDTGHGWEATHEFDGFDNLWASAEDAAHAVLGDPATAVRA